MNSEQIEHMKNMIELYKKIIEHINGKISEINYNCNFREINETNINEFESLMKSTNELFKKSDSILKDIDSYDTSVIGIDAKTINENKKNIQQNIITLKNNLIARYNKDIDKMEKRLADLADKASEHQDIIDEINKLNLPQKCKIHVDNYNTNIGNEELNYQELEILDKNIKDIENKLNIKRNDKIEDLNSEIKIFENKIEEIEHDFISLKDLNPKVTKQSVSNKIAFWNGKIDVLIAKLEGIKDRIDEKDYSDYQNIIAELGIKFKEFREELRNSKVSSYTDEIKKEYNSLKNKILEIPSELETLKINFILPFTKFGKIDGVLLKSIEEKIEVFDKEIDKINSLIEQKHIVGVLDKQLHINLKNWLNISKDKLEKLKEEVGIIEKEEEKTEEKDAEPIIEPEIEKTNEPEKKPLKVINKKSAKEWHKKFSQIGIGGLGLGLSLIALSTGVGHIVIPALIGINALYAFRQPHIMNSINNVLSKVIGATKNEKGEWVNSNGVVINPAVSLLKAIAVSGFGTVPVIKKLVSGVKKIGNMTPSDDYINGMRQKRVEDLYEEYIDIEEEVNMEDFLNEKGITSPTREMFIDYVNNKERRSR